MKPVTVFERREIFSVVPVSLVAAVDGAGEPMGGVRWLAGDELTIASGRSDSKSVESSLKSKNSLTSGLMSFRLRFLIEKFF